MSCDHGALQYTSKQIRRAFAAGITHIACPACAVLFEPATDDYDMDWYLIRSDLA